MFKSPKDFVNKLNNVRYTKVDFEMTKSFTDNC